MAIRDFDLSNLRLFVSVCEHRNMSRAGEEIGLVGSAVSKRMAQLESDMRVPLLLRRRHGVEPSPAGENLLEHARHILRQVDRVHLDMASFVDGVKGRIRLLATASVIGQSLADDVARFLQLPAYQEIRIDIEERLSADLIRDVSQGLAAVGVCWDTGELNGLNKRFYRGDHLAVVTHKDHPLGRFATVPFSAALDYEQISLASNSALLSVMKRQAAQLGKVLKERIFVYNLNAVLKITQANLGISILPMQIVSAYANTSELRVIPLSDSWAKRRFAMCFRAEEGLSPAVIHLLNFLEQCAKDEPPQ